jgi:mannitol/fructose-specific phosphotransferase system IIA component (Ntr-type)
MSQAIVGKAFTTLPPDADKRTVIRLLVEGLATARKIPPEKVDEVVDETMRREAVGSTGIGHGIGIPHCRTPIVDDILCAYGRAPDGIDFDSLDGEPVHSVFLLLTPPAAKEQHLQLMRSFASQIRKEHFTEFLRQVASAPALIELLAEFENR